LRSRNVVKPYLISELGTLKMAASVESYLKIIKRAHEGTLLSAFQRDWKWKPGQVMLLLDSLRQGFPIGSFLILQANPAIDPAPREFRGSIKGDKAKAEELVLDGQQRITDGGAFLWPGFKPLLH
jgi:hypothetical protein